MEINKTDLSNIRLRIVLLTLSILIPFIILLTYIFNLQFNRLQEIKVNQLKNVTYLVASENEQIVEGVRQLLISLSISPEIRQTPKLCSNYLSDLLKKYQRYGNFGVVDLQGNVKCSAITPQSQVNLSDRYFFNQTLKTNSFTIGEYVISKITNQSSINFGYPISSTGIIYATLNLSWLNNLVSDIGIDEKMTVFIVDRSGTILTRNPEPEKWVGKNFSNDQLSVKLTSNEGVFETAGTDGILRIYYYKKIETSDGGPYVIVGQEKSTILKSYLGDLKMSIILFIVTATISIWVGINIGNILIGKAVKKINELESLKRDFISLASHQIRTPVTAIKWFSEILLSKSAGSLTKKQERILKDTHLSAKRMIELIGTLLSISKLESNSLPINPSPTSMIVITNSVIKEIKTNFRNKKIKCMINVSSNFPSKVLVDQKLMRQVMLNLLHNSFKYSHQNSIINIDFVKQGKYFSVKITDNGIGIPKNELGSLFQKFSRATNSKIKDTEGAGLGLYLCKLIIKAHGGNIKFNEVKKGASVSFQIPLL